MASPSLQRQLLRLVLTGALCLACDASKPPDGDERSSTSTESTQAPAQTMASAATSATDASASTAGESAAGNTLTPGDSGNTSEGSAAVRPDSGMTNSGTTNTDSREDELDASAPEPSSSASSDSTTEHVASFGFCPGAPVFSFGETPCHATEDCAEGELCVQVAPTQPTPQCGSPCPGCFPEEGCYQDDECGMDHVCSQGAFTFRGGECADGCGVTGCAEGYERCDENGRHCQPIPCDEEGSLGCASDSVCRPDDPNANELGCARLQCWEPGTSIVCGEAQACAEGKGCVNIACQADSDCPCGSCLLFLAHPDDPSSGTCGPRPGFCHAPVATPTPNCPP